MKKIIITFTICLFALSCIAQNKATFKQTEGYSGKKLPFITETEFENIQINNELALQTIMEPNSIKKVVSKLGTPKNIEDKKDRAVDETVIFETKIINYEMV